ncbi:MAG: ABC transporter permease [Gulosibacter sp.]|uniref:ABC transporter permease n=1 Tax=Gulosibacter sp. TaxID=2817531 RepID=UPI003F8ED65C
MSATTKLAGKQLRRNPRRVLAIALAALLSAMAITATGTFISTLNASLQNELAAPFAEADAVVTTTDVDSTSGQIESNSEVASAEPLYSAYVLAILGNTDHQVTLQSVPESEPLRWMTLTEGSWPETGQIVLTAGALERLGLAVGDVIPASAMSTEPDLEFEVSGIVELPEGAEGAGITAYGTATDIAEIGSATEVLLQFVEGADAAAVIDSLNAEFGDADSAPEAMTTQSYIEQMVDQLTGGTNVLATVFLVFIAIALLAAAMVIRNTFQVLLAQRLRENGLLRLIGASGPQVQRTVLAEALFLGLIGSVFGLLVGFGLGWALATVANTATAGVQLAWGWMLWAVIATVALTVISAWMPARSASRLTPMAALHASATTEQGTSRRRVASWIIGAVLTVIGIAAAIYSAVSQNFLLLVPSGVVLAIGLIILVPLLVTVLMPVIARVTAGAGSVSKLAGENLVRTSRRTGTVILAIALGGSLVIGMLTALQSVSASLQSTLTEDYPVDLVVASSEGAGIPAEALADLESSDAVDSVASVRTLSVEPAAGALAMSTVAAAPNEWLEQQRLEVSDGELLVPEWSIVAEDITSGATVEITGVDGETVSLRIRSTELDQSVQNQMSMESIGVVSENTLAELGGSSTESQLWVTAADGESSQLISEIEDFEAEYPELHTYGSLSVVQLYEQVFQMVAAFVIGMLGLTIVISAIGLTSVVALAVAERSREISLLRALGLTRNKTRRMILHESITLAAVGAAFSLVIGIPLGLAATYSALPAENVVIALPWLGIIGVTAVALVLGIFAGFGPAQRATRIAPAQGLAND